MARYEVNTDEGASHRLRDHRVVGSMLTCFFRCCFLPCFVNIMCVIVYVTFVLFLVCLFFFFDRLWGDSITITQRLLHRQYKRIFKICIALLPDQITFVLKMKNDIDYDYVLIISLCSMWAPFTNHNLVSHSQGYNMVFIVGNVAMKSSQWLQKQQQLTLKSN